PTLPGVDEAVTPNQSIVDDRLDLDGHTGPSTRDEGVASTVGPVTGAGPVVPPAGSVMPEAGDAPYCYQCGVQMQRAGSCHACPSCGTTSGCS
ncbi:MAG: hypothetical protein M3Y91_11345, partial [Actinomycetota bacterium]|nr:hypothetical protein [Actinomycetota bacterium]